MKIIVAGASGFLGTALRHQLAEDGHDIVQLVRSSPRSGDQVSWDPASGRLDSHVLAGATAVINLGGAPIAHWPWTSSYKRVFRDTRVQATTTLANAIADLDDPPALLSGSGSNYYGDRGDESVDESSSLGTGYFSSVAAAWEAATTPASEAGARVVHLRTGAVLHRSGGAMKTLLLPFRLGLGGKIADGHQFFASISLRDYVAAVGRLLVDAALAGPFNLVAPVPATNADFTAALGRHLHRPTVIPVPGFAVRTVAGELSTQVLDSVHAVPTRLMEADFAFRDPTIDDQVAAALA